MYVHIYADTHACLEKRSRTHDVCDVIMHFIMPAGSSIVKAGGLPDRGDIPAENRSKKYSPNCILFINELCITEFQTQREF